MAASDAASLVAAAVRAACEARAPRRTVAAVAAAAVSAAAGIAAPCQQRRPRVVKSAPADSNVGGEEEEARREAIKAKRRRRRQRKKEARAAATSDKGAEVRTNTAQADAGMETQRTTDTATVGAGDAPPDAGEVTPPRRSKVPDVFEKGHTGLTPPCKRHCGDPTEKTGADPEDVSVDSEDALSGITIYTESEGGSAHPLWSPSVKIGRSEAIRRWEEHKQMKRGEVPKLPAGSSKASS